MAQWISLALLSALAVSALSLPQPDDGAYNIPRVGTGRRSQYYVLHSDGTFKPTTTTTATTTTTTTITTPFKID
ncbi:hypothetical protein E2C01_000158 [Portunus trituberculatus]|uniref:Uncharacterized protein n=1 Tax=Portunus trituberculatus TaxID=210409 RepID=A0A5B7CFR9_PORTR|nr:hypothetical protein [Portunus trituberculatus]